ncbi:alpha/beta hydrolase [Fulvivirgaceae bacterium BMA12]|uniref:Alpha/beta hydrolase n=1 Tax=Agaribacillus aureus TaxID=3051825 RepID=A0ABT8LIC0_9BACT|nr:alpha/beta hydrolase [Fulvivirgaceae bacterium BMA12]
MKKILHFIFVSLIFAEVYAQIPKNTEIVELKEVNLYYEEYGEGEPLILLHGWTQSSQFWADYIEEYARSYNVYAIDLRGHGKSSPLTKNFSIEKAANDISALLDYLDLKNVKSIGLSYGGLTLLQLASLDPKRLASMVLIGTSHNYSGQDNKTLSEQFRFENLPAAFIEDLKKIHFQDEDKIKAMFDPTLNYEIKLTEESLKRINIKTLIIHGDNDELLGINAAFELHKNLPISNLWIVPDKGHIPIDNTNKTEFLRITNEFFR